MKEFLDNLQSYISTKLANDVNMPTVKVNRAYNKNNKIDSPQISLYVLSDDDYSRASSFDGESATTYPVQFYCYWKDGVKYGNNAYGAQMGAELLYDKLSAIFDNKSQITQSYFNNNIKLIQKTGGKPFGMPVNGGSTNYFTVLRIVFVVNKPYTVQSVNNNIGE